MVEIFLNFNIDLIKKYKKIIYTVFNSKYNIFLHTLTL